MRASDLLGRPVQDRDGSPLGRVLDLHLLEGPRGRLVVAGVVVGRRPWATALGFDQPDQGPGGVGRLVRRLSGSRCYCAWEDLVVGGDDSGRVLRAGRTGPVPALSDPQQ